MERFADAAAAAVAAAVAHTPPDHLPCAPVVSSSAVMLTADLPCSLVHPTEKI